MKLELRDLIIIGLFLWLILQNACKKETVDLSKQDTVIINYTPPPVLVNVPPSKPTVIYKEVPVDADTSEIIKAYFSEAHYQDTTQTDSIQIWVDEVVSRNQIQSRQIGFKYLFPPCSTVIMPDEKRRKVLVGLNFTYVNRNKLIILPQIGYQPKNGNMFTAGFNGKQVSVGYFHKIKLRN